MEILTTTYVGNQTVGVTVTGMTRTPGLVFCKERGANLAVCFFATMAAGGYHVLSGATAQLTGGPTLTSTGFTIPSTNTDVKLNAVGITYDVWMIADTGDGLCGGTSYANNNTDDRSITIPGLFGATPNWAIVCSQRGVAAVVRWNSASGDSSSSFDGALTVDHIQAFQAGGIQVGNSTSVNGSVSTTIHAFAIVNNPLFYAFVANYTGTGISHNETDGGGAGFTPDGALVHVTDGSQSTVMKFRTEASTSSHRFNANAESTTNITALVANGFTVGATGAVNVSGLLYSAAVYKDGLRVNPPHDFMHGGTAQHLMNAA